MSYQIKDETCGVHVFYRGPISGEEFLTCGEEVRALAAKIGAAYVIANFTEATVDKLPKSVILLGAAKDYWIEADLPDLKIAIISTDSELIEKAATYINAPLTIAETRIFPDLESARAWVEVIQLIYVSSATSDLAENELSEILESSVKHNAPQQVTGMLLYRAGNFMQVLEGPAAAVDETFSRIQSDRRHHRIITLSRDVVKARQFAKWSMGYKRLIDSDSVSHPALASLWQNGFDAKKIGAEPGTALELLLSFSQSNR